jgi:hypothetical protein
MSKMDFHDPFEYLQHKLWPKIPLKVNNPPKIHAFKSHATLLKALNEGYNFS